MTRAEPAVESDEAEGSPSTDPVALAAFLVAIVGLVSLTIVPAVAALFLARRAERRIVAAEARVGGANLLGPTRLLAHLGIWIGILVWGVVTVYVYRDGFRDVQQGFFNWQDLKDSWPAVRKGFWLNIQLFMVAEFFVLIWAMVLALARIMPGRSAAPVRWLAVGYIDVFRGLPAIVTIYLVGFGLPTTGIEFFREMSLFRLGVIALTLVYGAYVAEVYRAGIESVHWSQWAAARSLGLTYGQTMRHVIVPQAVRRVIPPLLNDFIGLQKDTALVTTIGILEGFNRAQIYASANFNSSSVVGLGICFVVITIPLARVTDYLLKREQRRLQAVA
jgi:polar amino acid transport system permease protein